MKSKKTKRVVQKNNSKFEKKSSMMEKRKVYENNLKETDLILYEMKMRGLIE